MEVGIFNAAVIGPATAPEHGFACCGTPDSVTRDFELLNRQVPPRFDTRMR